MHCAPTLLALDAICHQAGRVGLGLSFDDVTDYVSHNDFGTASLLRVLWNEQFSGRFVLAGSMVVYGEGLANCPIHGAVRPAARRVEDLKNGRFEARCPECETLTTWALVDETVPADPRNTYAGNQVAPRTLVHNVCPGIRRYVVNFAVSQRVRTTITT